MSKTVESVYKFHGDTNVHDSPNMERGTEVNRIQKPSKLRIIAFKICKPIQSFGKHVKQQFLLDPSESWKHHSLGLLTLPKRGTTLIKSNDVALAFCCPCFLHGINASDIMTGIEGKYEKDQDSGKWVGARFVCAQAMICCGGPCCCLTAPAAGGAVREQIFEQSLRAGKEDEKKVNEKMFFTKRLQMFCLPYCCCPCFFCFVALFAECQRKFLFCFT